jgi:hypothetical protein
MAIAGHENTSKVRIRKEKDLVNVSKSAGRDLRVASHPCNEEVTMKERLLSGKKITPIEERKFKKIPVMDAQPLHIIMTKQSCQRGIRNEIPRAGTFALLTY